MALVVDWLDACRHQQLEAVLGLFDNHASLECRCDGIVISGRAALAAYWRSKLVQAVPGAFALDEITPLDERVLLDCSDFSGRRVQIAFTFNTRGKIAYMACAPRRSG
jgi:hypothetical protein